MGECFDLEQPDSQVFWDIFTLKCRQLQQRSCWQVHVMTIGHINVYCSLLVLKVLLYYYYRKM